MALKFEMQYWSIDLFREYENNPRLHDVDMVNKTADAIREFGFRVPVVAKSDGLVVDGHLRLKAARVLGLEEVPVLLADDLTDVQIRAFRLSVNKVADLAQWNFELLAEEIQELDLDGFDTSVIGFSDSEIDALLEGDFDALTAFDSGGDDEPESEEYEPVDEEHETPEPQPDPVSVLGDVWVLGDHRVMCGDGTSIDAVEKLMGGAKADMVFTDPPYGIGFNKEGQRLGKSQAYGAVLNDDSNAVAIDAFNLSSTVCDGAVFFWGANHYSCALPPSACWIVWDKQGGKRTTFADVELCYTNISAPARLFTHIWDGFRRDSEVGDKRVHPTQKPVQLIVDIWAFFDSHIKGSTVLDLFGGSGSTLIACENTGRKCRMMELDPRYVDVIVKRWQNHTGEQAVLESTGQTFDEVMAERDAA